MKERELREMATCKSCGKKLGTSFLENHTLPMFWKVTFERYILDDQAMKRQAGLEMMVGHVAIAQALSPNEEMANLLSGPTTVCICEHCAMMAGMPIAALAMEDEDQEAVEKEGT